MAIEKMSENQAKQMLLAERTNQTMDYIAHGCHKITRKIPMTLKLYIEYLVKQNHLCADCSADGRKTDARTQCEERRSEDEDHRGIPSA